MKFKTTFKISLIAVIFGLIFSTSSSIAQENSEVNWTKMSQNTNATFFEVQQDFYEYWENRPITKGSGYKPFKRWEAFMKPRVGPSGDMSAVTATYDNFMTWQDEYNASPASRNVLPGDWTALGPVGKPVTPFGQEFATGTGRVNFVKIHPTNSQTIFIGTPDGGVWKTTNGGTSWSTSTDFLGVIGCSDLVFDPTNPQIMYLATGDIEGNKNSIGILKSIDGGTSWNTTGFTFVTSNFVVLSKLLIDPTNALNMIVATNQGVAKTTDGWATWANTNFPGAAAPGLKDMELKPGDPNTVYASGTELYKSVDFGANWVQITNGLPNANISRIALAVSPANANYVYAVYGKASDQSFMGLYRSTDSGTTFNARYTGPLNLLSHSVDGMGAGGQAFYDLELMVSPVNAEKVTLSSVNQWQTGDGGTNWNIVSHWAGAGGNPFVHADVHALQYDPANNTTFYSGNDGGIFKTTDDGVTWNDISGNLNISQIVRFGISQQDATKIIIGTQDNGTSYKNGAAWTNVDGGDGGECIVDYSNNNTLYFSYIFSEISRSDDGGVTRMRITNGLPFGNNTIDFYSSFHQDPVAPATLYAGGHPQLYKTTNRGDNWGAIGTPSGNGNVTEFAIAPSNPQTIYAVKWDAVSKSTDGGATFTNVTGTIPNNSAFSMVAIKNNDANIVWVTQSGFSAGEKVWKSTNGGGTWTNVSAGLPNMPINTVVSVNNSPIDAIYVGADIGVYYLDNTGASFTPYSTNLPNVAVRDLEIHYPTGKIRAATYGRGVWESNDNPLGIEEDVFANGIVVYPNPVSDELTIELPNNATLFKFDIVNTNGQIVYSGSLQDKTIIDTSSFATGLYIIKLENNKTFEFKKIIKR